jgi:hypothetical protein
MEKCELAGSDESGITLGLSVNWTLRPRLYQWQSWDELRSHGTAQVMAVRRARVPLRASMQNRLTYAERMAPVEPD